MHLDDSDDTDSDSDDTDDGSDYVPRDNWESVWIPCPNQCGDTVARLSAYGAQSKCLTCAHPVMCECAECRE